MVPGALQDALAMCTFHSPLPGYLAPWDSMVERKQASGYALHLHALAARLEEQYLALVQANKSPRSRAWDACSATVKYIHTKHLSNSSSWKVTQSFTSETYTNILNAPTFCGNLEETFKICKMETRNVMCTWLFFKTIHWLIHCFLFVVPWNFTPGFV